MDQMLGNCTTKRKTNRWPLALFYNIMDIACLAAYIIHKEQRPETTRTDRRKFFLKELSRDLCLPSVQERSMDQLTTRFYFIKTAMECVLDTKIVNTFISPLQPNTNERNNTGRLKVQGICKKCITNDKIQRKSRKRCHVCSNPVCDTHTASVPVTCFDNII